MRRQSWPELSILKHQQCYIQSTNQGVEQRVKTWNEECVMLVASTCSTLSHTFQAVIGCTILARHWQCNDRRERLPRHSGRERVPCGDVERHTHTCTHVHYFRELQYIFFERFVSHHSSYTKKCQVARTNDIHGFTNVKYPGISLYISKHHASRSQHSRELAEDWQSMMAVHVWRRCKPCVSPAHITPHSSACLEHQVRCVPYVWSITNSGFSTYCCRTRQSQHSVAEPGESPEENHN